MIDKPLVTPDQPIAGGADVDVSNAVSFDNPDGSIDVFLDGLEEEMALHTAPFDANLAEYLPENTLGEIANDLRFAIDEDKQSRREWEDALTKGMDLLGIKEEIRSMPWPGACGVVHPMLLEAAVRFQSKTITRLFPATGPAQAKVQGESDAKRMAQAKRVSDDLNLWLTEKMNEYRDETEQMLFALPIDGSAFKKIYFDPLLRRPVAQFIPANDFLMPWGFPNLETCPRYTHVMKKAYGDVRQLQDIGFYRDIQLTKNPVDLDRMEEKVTRLSGIHPSYTRNELITLWECTADLMIEDKAQSYVVTLESDSNRILSIYRNWTEGDTEKRKVMSYVHYRYVPWKGPYGLGLIHLIGGIGRSTTSILRQLVDAGTLSNLPGGLKSKTLRIKGDNDPIQPGEFRDVDVPAGKILDSIAFIPYKEPSAVLFQLLQMLVEEGKSFASIAELDIATSAQNAPVGTVLALIERATEVITAVQSRMHIGLARELTLVAEIIRDNTPGVYDYDPPGGLPRDIKEEDYHSGVSILPVSDPAAATTAQKIMEYQAALQLSSQAPQLYDLPLLHRSMIQVLGIDNAEQIVPDKTAADPMDPVAENMALLTSKPVKAFQWQDHQAHIAVHQAFMKDPKIQQALAQNPLAASIQQATFAHLNEHLAYQYRTQIEQMTGAPLPPLGSKLPAEAEEQLSSLVVAAAQKVLQRNMADQQQQQAQQQQQDPIVQMQQQELQLKQQSAQQKAQTDAQKLQLEQQRTQQKGEIEANKIASEERRTAMQVQAENERAGIAEIAESHRAHAAEHAETTRHLMQLRNDREKNLHDALNDSHQTMLDSIPGPAPAPDVEPPLE